MDVTPGCVRNDQDPWPVTAVQLIHQGDPQVGVVPGAIALVRPGGHRTTRSRRRA